MRTKRDSCKALPRDLPRFSRYPHLATNDGARQMRVGGGIAFAYEFYADGREVEPFARKFYGSLQNAGLHDLFCLNHGERT